MGIEVIEELKSFKCFIFIQDILYSDLDSILEAFIECTVSECYELSQSKYRKKAKIDKSTPMAQYILHVTVISTHSIWNVRSTPAPFEKYFKKTVNKKQTRMYFSFQYGLHKIGRDVEIFTLTLMTSWPWCLTLTLLINYIHIQRIEYVERSKILHKIFWLWP